MEEIQLIRVWLEFSFFFFFFPSRSVYCVCQAKQADKFAGFQLAGCTLKAAGAEWKVNVSYHMNLSGHILQFSSALTANVLFFFLHLGKVNHRDKVCLT